MQKQSKVENRRRP